MSKVLIIGASGLVGSHVVKALDQNHDGIEVVLATSRQETAEEWKSAGRSAVVLDLNDHESFADALNGIDRLFLLTGYTSAMLVQSKMLVDAAVDASVKHIVHLGTYTSRRDPIPHFVWHDLIENYIASSGIAWTNIHPNVITDSFMGTVTITDTQITLPVWGDVPQGYVCAKDIGEVAATVLREGPEKHSGKDYYLSIDVLNTNELANITSTVSGKSVHVEYVTKESMEANFATIGSVPVRAYMQSAVVTFEVTKNETFKAQNAICDDVLTVTGHPGTSMKEWLKQMLDRQASL